MELAVTLCVMASSLYGRATVARSGRVETFLDPRVTGVLLEGLVSVRSVESLRIARLLAFSLHTAPAPPAGVVLSASLRSRFE
jgi:hypothetical protein